MCRIDILIKKCREENGWNDCSKCMNKNNLNECMNEIKYIEKHCSKKFENKDGK